jgi:hypothetical protein
MYRTRVLQIPTGFRIFVAVASRDMHYAVLFEPFHDNHSLLKHQFIHSSVALQPIVAPWPLFQFRNPVHNR